MACSEEEMHLIEGSCLQLKENSWFLCHFSFKESILKGQNFGGKEQRMFIVETEECIKYSSASNPKNAFCNDDMTNLNPWRSFNEHFCQIIKVID